MNKPEDNLPQLFIELFNYRSEWLLLPVEARETFASRLGEAMRNLESHGIAVLAWGMNDRQTDRRAEYDFFCVYRLASADTARQFEAGVAQGDWYRYFDQVIVSGAAESPDSLLAKMVRLQVP